MQESQAQNAELAKQTIEGIRVVRSFKGEKVEVMRYNDALEQMYNIKRQKGIYSAVHLLIRRVRRHHEYVTCLPLNGQIKLTN